MVGLFWSKAVMLNLILDVKNSWLVSQRKIVLTKFILESQLLLSNWLLKAKSTILVGYISISASSIRPIEWHTVWT